MPKALDLSNQRFGRLTAIRQSGLNQYSKRLWLCLCDCGNERLVITRHLLIRKTKSCGCLRREEHPNARAAKLSHGRTVGHDATGRLDPTYAIWIGMRSRCNDQKQPSWKNYGGRGILYDPRWEQFENFLEDMGERPSGLTLDRIDNNAGYSKSNCRWATRKQQNRNNRRTRFLEHKDRRLPTTDWAEVVGLNRSTLYNRLHAGWSVERALTEPVHQ